MSNPRKTPRPEERPKGRVTKDEMESFERKQEATGTARKDDTPAKRLKAAWDAYHKKAQKAGMTPEEATRFACDLCATEDPNTITGENLKIAYDALPEAQS